MGLATIAPYLDDLGDGASPQALCRHMLSIGQPSGRGRIRRSLARKVSSKVKKNDPPAGS